jgi:rare lipoprotein A
LPQINFANLNLNIYNHHSALLKLRNLLLLFCLPIFLSNCTSLERFTDRSSSANSSKTGTAPIGMKFKGWASYYSNDFHNRKTASGDIYDKNKLTAAHRDLPFGTKLRVRNLKNQRSVIVVVNDRGPFVACRMLDLSYRAAQEIDMIKDGIAEVEIEILQ